MKDGGISIEVCETVSCLHVMDKFIVNCVMDVQSVPGLVLRTKWWLADILCVLCIWYI